MKNLLHVIAQEYEHGEEAGTGKERGQVGPSSVPLRYDPNRKQRVTGAGFDQNEGGQQDHGYSQEHQRCS